MTPGGIRKSLGPTRRAGQWLPLIDPRPPAVATRTDTEIHLQGAVVHVDSLDRTIDFYTQLLDLEVVRRTADASRRRCSCTERQDGPSLQVATRHMGKRFAPVQQQSPTSPCADSVHAGAHPLRCWIVPLDPSYGPGPLVLPFGYSAGLATIVGRPRRGYPVVERSTTDCRRERLAASRHPSGGRRRGARCPSIEPRPT